MNPREISDIKFLQDTVVDLLNRVEELSASVLSSQAELLAAQEEILRLKGEKGRPVFGPKKRGSRLPKAKDSSSSGAASSSDAVSETELEQEWSSDSDEVSDPVDETVVLALPPSELPADAVFKGYRKVYQRDICIHRSYTEYQIARWYSASEGKTYESALPQGAVVGIGPTLRSFIQSLHHGGDMTHRKIGELLSHLGIELSPGTISDVLTHSDWIEADYMALLCGSLAHSPYIQIDSTSSREKGQGTHTQVLCGEFFSLFSTQQGRSRLDVYAALQGQSRQEVQLAYTPEAVQRMQAAKVSNKHLAYFADEFELGTIFSFETLEAHFEAAEVFAKTNQTRRSTIAGALAAGYYHQQEALPKVACLLSDDAREYQKVATDLHQHCWVHAIRPYRKLTPTQPYLQKVHQQFMDQLWTFYDQLRIYRNPPPDTEATPPEELKEQFDQLFDPNTDYHQLNQQIEKTCEKRPHLLSCLEHPQLPLHNNAAERAARRVVRKRDISLHTWSKRGTRIRDAFMSLHQTARKLRISFFDYIKVRNQGDTQITTMAQIVEQRYQAAKSTPF